MTDLGIGITAIGALIFLIMLGVPIAVAMGLSGFVAYLAMAGWSASLFLIRDLPYHDATSYSFTVIPTFIAMGLFASAAGIAEEMFTAAAMWFKRIPGTLAVTTIATCTGFAAMCGSTIAAAAALGRVCIPEMRKRNYDAALATGSVAAAGALAVLIPPSALLVIYGIMTEVSIGKLLIAGILPGLLLASLHTIVAISWALIDPRIAPPYEAVVTWKEKFIALKGVVPMAITFMAMIGGMFAGVMTPTEAGAVGATITLCFLIWRKGIGRPILTSIYDTVKTACSIMMIIICALLFGTALNFSGLPALIAGYAKEVSISPYVVLGIIAVIYLFLGCIMDSLGMTLITLPIIFPLAMSVGFDPVWFGIFVVMMNEIGQITPPVGLNVLVVSGIVPDVPVMTVFKGACVFLFSDIVCVVLLVIWPEIATYLPSKMIIG